MKQKIKDYVSEAVKVLTLHAQGYMESTNYIPENADELVDILYTETSSIITRKLMDEEYTLFDWMNVRAELASLIWNLVKRDELDKEMRYDNYLIKDKEEKNDV